MCYLQTVSNLSVYVVLYKIDATEARRLLSHYVTLFWHHNISPIYITQNLRENQIYIVKNEKGAKEISLFVFTGT